MKFIVQFACGSDDKEFYTYLHKSINYSTDEDIINFPYDYVSICRLYRIKVLRAEPIHIAATIATDNKKNFEQFNNIVKHVVYNDFNFLLDPKYRYDEIEVGNSWAVCHIMCLKFHKFVEQVIGGTSRHIPIERVVLGELSDNILTQIPTHKGKEIV